MLYVELSMSCGWQSDNNSTFAYLDRRFPVSLFYEYRRPRNGRERDYPNNSILAAAPLDAASHSATVCLLVSLFHVKSLRAQATANF